MLTFIKFKSKYDIICVGDFMDKYALGNFLAELRNQKGLTQEQLSEMINVNYKTISKWENGNSLPSLDTLSQLCEIYNVSLYEMSIYKRIDNPLISKDNIKKIINKNSIIKYMFLKIFLLVLSIIALIFVTYTFIYTTNNYGQMAVYELKSEDEYFDINGLYIEANDEIYILISKIEILNTNNKHIYDTTKKLKYSLFMNNQLIESKDINFEHESTLEDILSSINIYISKKQKINKSNNLKLTISYKNNQYKEISFIIYTSPKHKNNKLFY